jgi:nucleoside 2-deoxyribosyltransferase
MRELTELVYLAAPFEMPQERSFNDRLSRLTRAYNYPLFMPQELLALLEKGEDPFPDFDDHADQKTLSERFGELRMNLLNRANLVVAVYHGDEFDPLTAFEVGYALGRRTNVVAVRSEPLVCTAESAASEFPSQGCLARMATPHLCSRVVIAPYDDENFPDRLIPILNRYFVPHKL